MTEFSRTEDKEEFDGNTFLLDCEDNEYVYFSGLEIFRFKTVDKITDYISLMGNNMVHYVIMVGKNYTYFTVHHYKFFGNNKIEEGTLLDSPDPINYHVEKCGIVSFINLARSLIHTFWPGVGEDTENEDDFSDVEDEVKEHGDLIETQYFNGKNEVVKIFNQKCVICLERKSNYDFRLCGYQCICEQCHQIKGDTDILKFVICRT